MAKLRMGVVGMGMGKGHAQGFHTHPGAELVALCDVDERRLQAVADAIGVTELYTDAETMFRKAGLDAVGIAVPNNLHAALTISALRQGLHVLCEKPMAMTVAEARRMNDVAAKTGLNLMIDFSHRFTDAAAALKQQVDAGVVGDIYFGRTAWHRNRGIPGFGGWFGIQEMSGGGPLVDIGVHMIDLAMWFMGYPDPVSVTGSTYDKIAAPLARRARKKYSVEDLACGMVKFSTGATLIVESSWAVNQPGQDRIVTTLCGDKGGLSYKHRSGGGWDAELYTDERGDLYTKRLDTRTVSTPSPFHDFVDSIIEGRPPLATGDHGLKVMKVIEGIYRSAKSGKEVRYRPV